MWLVRRRKLVLTVAASLAVIAGVAGSGTPDHLSYRTGDLYDHDSESFRAASELERVWPKKSLGLPDLAVLCPERRSTAIAEQLESLPQIAETQMSGFYSKDQRSTYVVAWLRKDASDAEDAAAAARHLRGPGVLVGGPALGRYEFEQQVKEDLRHAEIIGLPLLVIIGLWIFRSLVAALLPVLFAFSVLMITLGCLRGATEIAPISVFSLNTALALAIGLTVDYSLLMLSRFREELAAGNKASESAATTLRTAGRTIAFSAGAIAASFAALFFFPVPFLRSTAFCGALVAVLAGLGTILIMPPLLALLGQRVNALALRRWRRAIQRSSQPRKSSPWYRISRFSTERRLLTAALTLGVLATASLYALRMNLTGLDATSLPAGADARVFTERLRSEFEFPLVGELQVAVHGNESVAWEVFSELQQLSEPRGLGKPFPFIVEHSPTLWQLNLNPSHPVLSPQTEKLTNRIRELDAPITVGGETAAQIDTASTLADHLPAALAVVVLASFGFVFWATGSLILPVKSLLMNILALGAAFGLLAFIFQEGRLEDLFGYESQGAVVATLPLVMTAAAFGLLTDYGLFVLLRIKEERERGYANREAINRGLERVARVVSAAAILFSVAVSTFATAKVLFLKEAAIGIVAAVLIDAFVVRPFLVPSLMAILGDWNWWPRKIDSVKPKASLGESAELP